MDATKTTTIRVQQKDGDWHTVAARVLKVENGGAEVSVPEWNGHWGISRFGMFANYNGWAIYTLHPDDCERIVGNA